MMSNRTSVAENDTIIVGIVLVRNEDIFLDQVLHNIAAFCDHIIVADHASTDGTAEIVRRFCKKNSHCRSYLIEHPRQSHDLIREYTGRKVWVFGVDGDELYEPERLAVLRSQLKSGEHDDYWMILGSAIHCVHLDLEKNIARGYIAPPCRSMTKLYNFNAIVSWDGDCPERLHGGRILFKAQYDWDKRYYLYKEVPWGDSIFRCLHLCFLPRSSKDKQFEGQLLMRKNIADGMSENIFQRFMSRLFKMFGINRASPLKCEKYMRGEIREVDIRSFML